MADDHMVGVPFGKGRISLHYPGGRGGRHLVVHTMIMSNVFAIQDGINDLQIKDIFVIIILILMLLSRRIGIFLQTYSIAYRDFHNARGTKHLEILTPGLAILRTKYLQKEMEINELSRSLEHLRTEKEHKLVDTLSKQIILENLPDATGIGEKLTEKILEEIYDGTLRSLHGAFRVNGVGESKQDGINDWLKVWEHKFTELLDQEFQGKKEIIQKYEDRIIDNSTQLKKADRELQKLKHIGIQTRAIQKSLNEVTFQSFVQSIGNEGRKDMNMKKYLLGVHPEWEPAPEWFILLLKIMEKELKEDGE